MIKPTTAGIREQDRRYFSKECYAAQSTMEIAIERRILLDRLEALVPIGVNDALWDNMIDELITIKIKLEAAEVELNNSVPRSRLNAVDNEVEQLKADLRLTREAAKTEIRRLETALKENSH